MESTNKMHHNSMLTTVFNQHPSDKIATTLVPLLQMLRRIC